jgi:hypothetical protein
MKNWIEKRSNYLKLRFLEIVKITHSEQEIIERITTEDGFLLGL